MTSRDGTKIAFERSGEGPALVLVDGALCFRALGPMAALAELLTPDFTVYRYDRRGRGESGDTAPYGSLEGQSWGRVDPEALASLLRQFFA